MAQCDGFFDAEGIPFLEGWENRAVRAVLTADFYDPPYKKFLITCWFETTYGVWNGPTFDRTRASDQMREFLATSPFRNYEDMIVSPEATIWIQNP